MFWSEDEVKNRLKILMDRAFANVMHRSAKDGISHRVAATAMGVERVQARKPNCSAAIVETGPLWMLVTNPFRAQSARNPSE